MGGGKKLVPRPALQLGSVLPYFSTWGAKNILLRSLAQARFPKNQQAEGFMAQLGRFLVATLMVCLSLQAMGQFRLAPGKFEGPNGCGAAEGMKVPDKILGCQLKAACNQHDACYSACMSGGMDAGEPQCQYLRCAEGGDLAGSEICTSSQYTSLKNEAVGRKASCDVKFFEKMILDNGGMHHCVQFASVYRAAVVFAGNGNFNGMKVKEVEKVVPRISDMLRGDQLDKVLSNPLEADTDPFILKRLEKAKLSAAGTIPTKNLLPVLVHSNRTP